jgi:hypothetical protein
MRTRSSLILVASFLVVVGVALAGCGGGGGDALSQDEYQQQLDQISQDLTQSSESFGTELQSVLSGDADAGEAAADSIGRVAGQIRESASQLDEAEPPSNAEAANAELVTSLRAYADDLEELQEPLRSGDLTVIQNRLGELEQLDSVQSLQQASQDLEEAGYTFDAE